MWNIRNLKRLGVTEEQLEKVYIEQIRSVLEIACPVWHPGLTVFETRSIERLQKSAFAIIRGQNHTSYREAISYFNLKTLSQRRDDLCLQFAKKKHSLVLSFVTGSQELSKMPTPGSKNPHCKKCLPGLHAMPSPLCLTLPNS